MLVPAMTVQKLRQRFGNVQDAKGVLAILGDWSTEQKQTELYPDLVSLLHGYLCDTPPPELASLTVALRFVAHELRHEPELAARLYAAIGTAPVRHGHPALFELIVAARDRRAVPLLRGGAVHRFWVDAVIALHAEELLDEVRAALAARPSRELAVACGYIGGERVRGDLTTAGGTDSVHPVGLAFLANADDKAYFAGLGRTPNQTTARRIHTALTARGPKQRIDALGELADGLASTTEPPGAERLLACTLALGDKRADVVERAAAILAAHAQAQRAKLRLLFVPAFLERATRAIETGVTETARGYLDVVLARIPHARGLGTAAVIAARPTRKAAAKAKGAEMLEAMRDAVPAIVVDQRDPDIEAQIAADPDNRAGYLVYADWLQTKGDPRGTWITLHTVKGLAGREALDAFLREHRDALLGPVAPFLVDDGPLALDWYMGFVRQARLAPHATVDVLRAILDAPCGAFVQELVFASEATEPIVIELLRQRRPATLSRLVFGTRDDPPAELVAAMPRLRRDRRQRWADVLARIAEQRTVRVEIDAGDLPPLEPALGVTIDIDMTTILAGLKYELHLERAIGIVGAIPHLFTPASVDRFACALVEVWVGRGEAERLRWAFAAAGPLGGRDTARYLGAQLATLGSQGRVAEALAHLVRIGTPIAIEELARAALDLTVDHRLRIAAWTALAQLAETRGTEVDALIAAAAPSREPRSLAIQGTWLTSLMVDGRTLPLAAFRISVLGDPLRLAAARTLLWAEHAGDDLVGLFRVSEHGEPIRRDGSPYTPAHRIGLVHPAALSDSELASARRAFAGVEQAILQLERPVFGLAIDEARTGELTRFVKRRVGFEPISTTLRGRGWYVAASDTDDNDDDRWVGTRAFARTFARDGVSVSATLNATRGSIASVRATRAAACTFDELHVVTISELLWDLESAHGRRDDRPRPDAPPASRAAPPRAPSQPAPIVERAKSGRAKCVVCTEAIAKDAWRIGIERHVETPTFRGRATVWLHPNCRKDVPELAGVELADLP